MIICYYDFYVQDGKREHERLLDLCMDHQKYHQRPDYVLY